MADLLSPLKPIAIKERISVIFIEKGEIDVVDGAFVVVDAQGFRVRPVLTHIPVGGVACIRLEPGTRVSHRAAALAARNYDAFPAGVPVLSTATGCHESLAQSLAVRSAAAIVKSAARWP